MEANSFVPSEELHSGLNNVSYCPLSWNWIVFKSVISSFEVLVVNDVFCCTFYYHVSVSVFVITGQSGQKVLLITVPQFMSSHACVLLNLRTLSCTPLVFSSDINPSNAEWTHQCLPVLSDTVYIAFTISNITGSARRKL